MGEGLSLLEQTRGIVFMVFLIGLALLLFVALIRAIKGPQVADRLMAVNMMGTIVMVMLAILALFLGEDYLLDICLIYAMVSFLAVIVFSKVYIGIYEEKRHHTDGAGKSSEAAEGMAEAKGAEERVTDNRDCGRSHRNGRNSRTHRDNRSRRNIRQNDRNAQSHRGICDNGRGHRDRRRIRGVGNS